MKRIAMLIAAAALLNACGGGSDQAESQASASNESMQLVSAATRDSRARIAVAAPADIVVNRSHRACAARRGSVDVWVSLAQESLGSRSKRHAGGVSRMARLTGW